MGELSFIPFQVTWVWEAAVPLKEAVESVARPYDFMKTELLCESTSAMLLLMSSLMATLSITVFWVPMADSVRRAVTETPSISIVRRELSSCAAK